MKAINILFRSFLILFVISNSLPAQGFSEIQRGENGIPDASWPKVFFKSFDPVVSALRIPPLRDMDLEENSKEIRIWAGVGTGIPKSLYIISKNDNNIDGELILYWSTNDIKRKPIGESSHDRMVYYLTGSCENFTLTDEVGYCSALFQEIPNWEQIYQKVTEVGIWNLPDESELPSDGIVSDGWGLVVELHDSNQYRTYKYSNPDTRPWPEAEKADEIYSIIFTALDQNMEPSNVSKIYRGITTGEYRSAFRDCETGETWHFRASDNLESLANRDSVEFPDSGENGYTVEVFGTLSPGWAAKKYGFEYKRDIQVETLISIQSSNKANCK